MQPNTDPLDQLFHHKARLTVQYCLNLRTCAMRATVRHARIHTDPPANRARSISDFAKALQDRHAPRGHAAGFSSTAWLEFCRDGRLLLGIS